MPMPQLSSSIQAKLLSATNAGLENRDDDPLVKRLVRIATSDYTSMDRQLVGLERLSPETITAIKQGKITPPTAEDMAVAITEANRAESSFTDRALATGLETAVWIGLSAAFPPVGLFLAVLGMGGTIVGAAAAGVAEEDTMDASVELLALARKQNTFARVARMRGVS